MKKQLYLLVVISILITSCGPTSKLTKSQAYPEIYNQKPLAVLIMPPINRSTAVEAKEYFHTTLNVPIANAGYYVIPPFLSMEILKRESAYDSELFIDRSSLEIFRDIFGADIALFTIISKWDKSSVASNVKVEIEYIAKSTLTNEVLYSRKGEVIYNTSMSVGNNFLLNLVASALNTAATKYVDVAKACNSYTLSDLPAGKYAPKYGVDQQEMSGLKNFRVRLPK
jgi:hypothetical protein